MEQYNYKIRWIILLIVLSVFYTIHLKFYHKFINRKNNTILLNFDIVFYLINK